MGYVVANKRHRRGNEVFEVGQAIEPSEDELRSFPDRFEQVADAAPAAAEPEQTEGGARRRGR